MSLNPRVGYARAIISLNVLFINRPIIRPDFSDYFMYLLSFRFSFDIISLLRLAHVIGRGLFLINYD